MRRHRIHTGVLLISAHVYVFIERALARTRTGIARISRSGPLNRWHQRLAALPPGVALPLFLVPEAASRGGWLVSAWLLLNGAAWQALLVYVLTKLLATATALWIYGACHPALMRVKWFARTHRALHRLRRAAFPGNRRFAAMRRRIRPP